MKLGTTRQCLSFYTHKRISFTPGEIHLKSSITQSCQSKSWSQSSEYSYVLGFISEAQLEAQPFVYTQPFLHSYEQSAQSRVEDGVGGQSTNTQTRRLGHRNRVS
uniref:Uncharacterized protein n=1 Tax=Octactis speculum TaxID=3111310 RepID=A0A7S2E218_9STRA